MAPHIMVYNLIIMWHHSVIMLPVWCNIAYNYIMESLGIVHVYTAYFTKCMPIKTTLV